VRDRPSALAAGEVRGHRFRPLVPPEEACRALTPHSTEDPLSSCDPSGLAPLIDGLLSELEY
jgi:hypothetical protein